MYDYILIKTTIICLYYVISNAALVGESIET